MNINHLLRVTKLFFLYSSIFILGCDFNSNEANSLEAYGFSLEKLNEIDKYFEKSVRENKFPGAVALIRKNNKIIYNKAFGYADIENKIKFSKNHIFRIASMTKAVTSLGVLMLWEKNKFDLDDPIENYIPSFKNLKVLKSFNKEDSTYTVKKAKNKITIRHLLTHTSGIGYGIIDEKESFQAIYQKNGIIDLFTTKPITIKENVEKLAKLPLHHEPGEDFTYGEGLDVLGYFIEVISGMPLNEFFRKHIFEPLEMNDTYFYLPTSHYNRLVPVQTKSAGFWMKFEEDFYDINYPKSGAKLFFSGGAGLSSTANDYSNFLQLFLNDGVYNGSKILNKETIKLIHENQISHLPDLPVGLVFGILNKDNHYLGENGNNDTFTWGGYFNTFYFTDTKENLSGILLKQTRPFDQSNSNYEFKALVYESLIKN
jgi:CubicO group peptidase (beta-lactamase class C family)